MINTRHLENQLKEHFSFFKQAIVLLGARQVGKTTLLKRVFPEATYLLVDNEQTKKILETYDINTYKQILGKNNQVIIDELHLLSNPGRAVKIIYDQVPNIQLIVTGSSALHIKNKSSESMAGRKIEYKLFPLTFSEYLLQKGISKQLDYNILENVLSNNKPLAKLYSPEEILNHVLVYGLYPEIINLEKREKYLLELADSSIFKDIIELNLIEDRSKSKELLKLLAYQIGNLVNYSEIATKLSIDRRTVIRYIDILEESYIIYRVYPYSKNKRGEIGKSPKIFFHDLGLRNAVINNFDTSSLRSDMEAMFENFVMSEVKKIISYKDLDYEVNYWRLKTGSEVDIVLSNAKKEVFGLEVKFGRGGITPAFTSRYPNAVTKVINRKNFY